MYNRDSKIMRKLLGKSASDPSTGGDLSITSAPNAAASASAEALAYRPSQSQNAVYAADAPISCLDVSPDRHVAVLAGRHILKAVRRDDVKSFDFNLKGDAVVDVRAAISAQQQSSASRASVLADQLNIRDVKWHTDSSLFTACANGRIVNYDIARIGEGGSDSFDYIQIQEDSRQVNTLDVNPHLRKWLLSGSQDGMARVFDASSPSATRSGVLTFRQRFVPLKCIDSIRQVKWSPRVGHEMACCTEGGVIMKWDVRQASRPLLRINAHDKACTTIAWHPDGTNLISAGWDSRLHVWDLGNTADRRQKPKWSISTPAVAATVTWRPGLWSATVQSRRVAQVAVSYDETSSKRFGTPLVHVWDLARPTVPYKEIERFDSSPTALYWQDRDMLWTVGQDGMFNQCDLAFAPKVVDRLSTSATAFSPRGEALMFLDERYQPSRPRPAITSQPEPASRRKYGSPSEPQTLSLSKSDSEEDIVGSFLGPRRRMHHKRRLSNRSVVASPAAALTNAAGSDDSQPVLSLEQSIKLTGMFKSQQAMATGRVPAAKSVAVYQHLSRLYLETLERELPGEVGGDKLLVERIGTILEQFAKGAEQVSLFRLAQTWRVLAFAMNLLLNRRAQFHLDARVSHFQKIKIDGKTSYDRLRPSNSYGSVHALGDDTSRYATGRASSFDARSGTLKSLLSEEIESTSNQPTPIARPADAKVNEGIDCQDQFYQPGRKLTPIVEPSSLDLGPSARGSYEDSPRTRLDSVPLSLTSHDSENSHASITEGYDFYDTEALAQAIDMPRTSHDGDTKGAESMSSADDKQNTHSRQHTSNDSYCQFFSISGGTERSPKKNGACPNADLEIYHRGQEIEGAARESRSRKDTKSKTKRPSDSPEDVFQISQTTIGTDDSHPSQSSYTLPSFESDTHRPSPPGEARLSRSSISRSMSEPNPIFNFQHDPRPHVVDGDYLPWRSDPSYPYANTDWLKAAPPAPSPLDPYTLVKRALEFESRTSALNASAMILLLKPLVPESVIDFHQANAVLRQQHTRLMRMSLFAEAALLRNLCVPGWPEGLPTWGDNYNDIFAPAQQQNVKVAFACSSCHKPREMDPKDGDAAIWRCERCKSVMAPCAVCGHRDAQVAAHCPVDIAEALQHSADGVGSSDDDGGLADWWYCPGCSHGGHASCLETWHAAVSPSDPSDLSPKYSDGCCPLDGCGHACLPGKYRGETITARADELGRAAVETSRISISNGGGDSNSTNGRRAERRVSGTGDSGASTPVARSSPRSAERGTVRTDVNDVPQSRAVGLAREALNKTGGGSSSSGGAGAAVVAAGGGILSSSPARAAAAAAAVAGGERERRKSVKFARKD